LNLVSSYYAASIYIKSNLLLNINNNTIADNFTSVQIDGDGVYIDAGSTGNTLSFVNNIFFYNGLGQNGCQIFHPNYQPHEFVNNDIMNLGCGIPPIDNFDLMPEFIDHIVQKNYRLHASSQLIDFGDPGVNPLLATDLDGQIRVNGIIDLGAYEFYAPPIRKMIVNNSNTENISVYPNPAKDYIFIQNFSEKSIVSIQLFDAIGSLIFTKTVDNLNSTSFNICDLPKGLYILKINMNDEVSYKRFIKD
jgi:hypothetical protein